MYMLNTSEALLAAASLIGAYVMAVQYFRFQRCDRIESKFRRTGRLSSMTVKEAHDIMRQLRELEFPFALRSSTKMTTLKTASVPTVADLFVATGQRSEKNNTKRAADTEVIMNEIHDREAGSDAHVMAFARMNYIHSRYRKAGKILDEDMLHTLGSAVVDVFRSIEKYEWRQLSDVEKCAVGVFYRSMGEAMEIPFHLLPSGKTGFTDGIHFAQELCDFTVEYEKTAAKPTQSTLFISRRLMSLETANYPSILRPVVEHIIATRLDEHIRVSMGYRKPGITLSSLAAGSVAIRKFILRYLSLPRPDFMAVKVLDATPDPSTGRYTVKEWLDNPWYVKPTFSNRWGLKSWSVRLFGTGNVPTKNGPFRDEGYDIKAIGPQIMENKGQAEVEEIFENFRKRDIPAGCPFHA
ncbi:hypothetical protein ANOM_006406 [Aspergillus nomiae NRRL 13137]|uniref:ER-bound oxygenase mpaB/mpaB'/Rubber oxygenase catalytic domain-containing protein n=1 Tax=Aspergillus nomiae NRRL (strain ATCC 15546 / NRRL 13137 / CBS 260.88 / M93) TaxID=1509407 RepID=A0A0L1IZM8_ASPN3|nr:uncharacterized protein ANOM_006406 [Aspergillus nomiae NRRL 13137]KNG84932.1 hypothetical protein ANOM_006406 [Aspergillus nomiae NRRL 13137]